MELSLPYPSAALVLAGGGARGAYQVGLLRGIATRHPDLRFDIITGASAGAINAAFLATHHGTFPEATESLAGHWRSLRTARVMRGDVWSLLGNAFRISTNLLSGGSRLAPPVRGLVDTRPLRRFLTPLIDPEQVAANIRAGRLRALAISATSYATGENVTFVQAPPEVPMWRRVRRSSRPARIDVDHVMASAAIPLFFPACPVEGEFFGDGSLRQNYPLSPAVNLGADRILAVASRFVGESRGAKPATSRYPTAARVLGLMLNSIFLDQMDVDAERLERINELLGRVDPTRRWLVAEREVELLVLRPSRDIGRMAAAFEDRLPRALRYMIRGLGTRRASDADLLSYLVFERRYLEQLIELGERDAELHRARIAHFAEGCAAA